MKNKAAINTETAPQAIGPYSQAIKVGEMVFLSGQIPLLPESSELAGEDFDTQAKQAFKNLQQVCLAAGGDLTHVVKLTLYLTNLDNFATVNSVMMDYFQEPFPARAAVGVSQLPKGALIEVEGIMAL